MGWLRLLTPARLFLRRPSCASHMSVTLTKVTATSGSCGWGKCDEGDTSDEVIASFSCAPEPGNCPCRSAAHFLWSSRWRLGSSSCHRSVDRSTRGRNGLGLSGQSRLELLASRPWFCACHVVGRPHCFQRPALPLWLRRGPCGFAGTGGNR